MVLNKIKKHQAVLRKEVREKTINYMLAAFGFVAGLAWNEAIKSFIEKIFPHSSNSVVAKFTYAILVTVFIVMMTIYLVRFIDKKEEK